MIELVSIYGIKQSVSGIYVITYKVNKIILWINKFLKIMFFRNGNLVENM